MWNVSVLLIKALLVVGLDELQVPRNARRSWVMHLAPPGQQQQSLRYGLKVLLIQNDQDYNQKACNWALSIQGKCENY
jgi:hypothetical protein